VTAQLATKYDPDQVEQDVAQQWDDAGAFRADPQAKGTPYCIVIPPPNVTAALHLGHALNNTLQDILIRWHRMQGHNTVWIPGTDHAGIATQTVVEKRLLAEHGKKRTDFTRDEFIAKVQAWKDQYEQQITQQLKKMGCSCDWDRQRFTMDEVCAKAVREAFFKLFKNGLIYRGKRLVNWDPATQTALADDEVEMHEIDGHFYYLQYPLVDPVKVNGQTIDHITVATTRPETMLGDTAIAVNPKDPRAKALVGQKVRLPIVNRIIPIIADDYVVLPDADSDDPKARFATGFLKVTPAHDPNDWEIGLRHDLPVINVLAPDASISDQHGWPPEDFVEADEDSVPLGLDRYAARTTIVEWFRQNKLLEDVKPYRHSVGHSYRSHVAIEPYLSDQWYVKVKDKKLSSAALRAMANDQYQPNAEHADKRQPKGESWEGKLRFHPPRYAKTFQTWHENLRDWCISRQLWWGHRIPVWTIELKYIAYGIPTESRDDPAIYHKVQRDHQDQTLKQLLQYLNLCGVPEQDVHIYGTPETYSQLGFQLFHLCSRDPIADEALQLLSTILEDTAQEKQPSFDQLEQQFGKKACEWAKEHCKDFESCARDPDVLDTWFSSALWPFSTLGWPQDTPELQTWNPGHVLCTAREIITLWVSRMVMTNLYFRDTVPFTDVFIHAMIQDGQGRKMSKSLGNGVDPLDIIKSHGSDAMRYTLAAMTTNTQDVRLPVAKDPVTGHNTSDKFDVGRNFANKLWNAGRFVLQNLTKLHNESVDVQAPLLDQGMADTWVLSRLATTVRDANKALEGFQFHTYAQGLYEFFWRDLCDWYIEAVKVKTSSGSETMLLKSQRVLAACLDVSLRLLHPVMPFITEELWKHLNEVTLIRGFQGLKLPANANGLLVTASWPIVDEQLIRPRVESEFTQVQQIVGALRQVRTTHQVSPKQTVDYSATAPSEVADKITVNQGLIETLANVKTCQVGPEVCKPDDAVATVIGDIHLYLHGLVDKDAEKARLTKRLGDIQKSIGALSGRLTNKAYIEKAPAHLVEQTRDQLEAAQKQAQSLEQQLVSL